MTIDRSGPIDIRAHAAAKAAEAGERQGGDRSKKADGRQDKVVISDEARALANEGAGDAVPAAEVRMAEIQGRLENGYYGDPEVIERIAERIVDSGDL